MSLLRSAMETRKLNSVQLIFSAAGLSVFAGLGMMLSLMEGFRRATNFRSTIGDSGGGGAGPCCWCPSCWFRCRWPL